MQSHMCCMDELKVFNNGFRDNTIERKISEDNSNKKLWPSLKNAQEKSIDFKFLC